MKIGIFSAGVVAALFTGYYAYNTQNNTRLAGVVLANVEALADDASEATKAGICYFSMI